MSKTRLKSVVKPNSDMHNLRNYLLHGLFLSLYGLFKYMSFPLSNYFRYMILRIFANRFRTMYVSDGVTVWFPWRVKIGKTSSLNQGVIIDGYGGVDIGEGVRIAAYVYINTADHGYVDPDVLIKDHDYMVAGVIIEDDVWIGAGASINKGVRVGKGSVIGSGSVVTYDIPPYSIAVGVPCRVIRSRK